MHNSFVERGIGVPCGKKQYFDITNSELLKKMQERFSDLRLVVIDEFSMLKQKELYYIHKRLQQLKVSDDVFGGVSIVLVGDPAQLPPVKGNCLWRKETSLTSENGLGYNLYQMFDTVIILKENNRLDYSDSEAVEFEDFLNRLRNGENAKADWNLL